MPPETATIEAIYRYPVKGLSPEPLARVQLSAGATLPADRIYAIENGASGFNPATPSYLPKQRFLMLMRNERLAALRTHFDDATHTLTIRDGESRSVCGDLRTAKGRAVIERFFAHHCADELRGMPKILNAPGHSFSDVAKVVSIINLASVAAVEKAAGIPVNPLRFRGNVYVAGWPAWAEFDLLGRAVTIGRARLKVVRRIQRCAATDVDPDTGIRDLHIPTTLMRSFGHADCGVYAQVMQGGEVAIGDALGEAEDLLPPPFGRVTFRPRAVGAARELLSMF
jgi:uncharacterized protein YcbX